MNIVILIAQNLGVLVVAMTGLWLVSLALKNASIVDIFWGIAFVIVAWFSWLLPGHSCSFSCFSLSLSVLLLWPAACPSSARPNTRHPQFRRSLRSF
jgi:steroid 5-alpha reductase family enzyme